LAGGLGRAWCEFREAGPGDNYVLPGDCTEHEELNREGLLASVREYLEFFPLEIVRDGPLSINDDLIMECLINTIRNETISYQQFTEKIPGNKKRLLERIKELKRVEPPGSDRILEAESILNTFGAKWF
jgi:hypothetical protein